jgi:serralysin
VIWGGAGGDFIDGAGGDDLLIGGSGDDAYTVTAGSGFDRIRDFTTGGLEDRVVLVEMGPFFATFEQVMDAAVQQGSDTIITFAAGHGLILEGVSKAALTVDDFVF